LPDFIAYKLLEACDQPGCPLCRLEQQSVRRYLENQFYENVNSPQWRDRLRASHGFCHEHAWLAVDQRLGDALGLSIIYHDLLDSLRKQLDDQRQTTTHTRKISLPQKLPEAVRQKIENAISALTPRKHCPVCEERDETTRAALMVFLKELETAPMQQALQASDGLCLPHLRMALKHVQAAATYDTLLKIQRDRLETLSAELAEFIRKNDYQNIREGFGKEGDAWRRAVALVVGSRREK